MLESSSLATNNTINQQPLQGWTPAPHGRGTWSLIFSCLSTIFLCTWVIIHPRIDNRSTIRVLHKFALSIKAFIAPEFIAVESAQEWAQARRIVKRCSPYTNGEFRLVHAFYLGMFGIRYRIPTTQNLKFGSKNYLVRTRVLWPMQYVFLLENGYISWANRKSWGLCDDLIKDKSNADSAAKLIAILGVSKFTIESMMRVYHHLPLAPLESMTLSYIPLFMLSYFFWWIKPKDVCTPTIVDLPPLKERERDEFDTFSLTDAFDDEGKCHQESLRGVWRLTPRDFERDLLCGELLEVPTTLGQGTVLSHWDPDLYHSWLWPVATFFGLSFGALHLMSWNTTFPTPFEQWIWRLAAIVSMAAVFVFMQFRKVVLCWTDLVSLTSVSFSILYIISRVAAVAEAFASLRASAPAVYQT